MNIGIIGLGSIGKRHIRCLSELGYRDICALRSRNSKRLPQELEYVKEYYDEKAFYSNRLDGVIISNPTSHHISSAIIALKKGMPIFIEKPLAANMEEIDMIKGHDISRVMVGYCLRYHEIINKVKEFIDSGRLGKLQKADLYVGHYLPDWHPDQDYRNLYFSKKNLGGGVVRTLSHEIDLIGYLFGKIDEVFAKINKISDLEIDVEDNAYILLKGDLLTSLELDYLNPVSTRKGMIVGSKGRLEYSFSDNSVRFTDYGHNEHIIYENNTLAWNHMYEAQMKDFISFIKNRKTDRMCGFREGVDVIKIIENAEESNKRKCWKKVEV